MKIWEVVLELPDSGKLTGEIVRAKNYRDAADMVVGYITKNRVNHDLSKKELKELYVSKVELLNETTVGE